MLKDEDWMADTPPPTIPNNCPLDYDPHGDSCYKLFHGNEMSWYEASDWCAGEGGNLASIHSAADQAFISLETEHEDVWIGFINLLDEWEWSNGWPVSYTHWGVAGSPDNETGCAVLNGTTGLWIIRDCDTHDEAFICKISQVPMPTTPQHIAGDCPTDWVPWGSHCYHFELSDMRLLTWQDAEDTCNNESGAGYDGHLTSIHSQAENDFIYDYIVADGNYFYNKIWIGMFKEGLHMPVQWTDNSTVDYTYWIPGEPNDGDGTNLYIQLDVMSWPGLWADDRGDFHRGYICKTDKQVPLYRTPTPSH